MKLAYVWNKAGKKIVNIENISLGYMRIKENGRRKILDILRSDIKRALTSWGFFAGIIGMILIILIGASVVILPVIQQGAGEGLAAGFHARTLLMALSSDVMLLCAPILCALPYTAAFVDDYKSGYLKEYLPRSGKERYIKGKVAATALSGGLCLFIGIIAAYILFALVFMPMELAPKIQTAAILEEMDRAADIAQPSLFAVILGRASIFFLFGSLWSLVGALLSSVTMSKYMAYASPFIIYYVLVILCERYIKSLYVINPQQWLTVPEAWPGGGWGVALFLVELIAILSIGFALSVSGRLSDA